MDYNPFTLAGKAVLVTGASSGIGRAAAIECSKMGAHLVVTGRNGTRLQETLEALHGEGHRQILAELTDDCGLSSLVESVTELDGLVLCAGTALTLPFQFCTQEKVDALFKVNVFAPLQLLRMLVKQKKLNKGASVVFVSSVGGVRSFAVGSSIYGESKAALNAGVKYCAKELAPRKVRVNSVNPGMVDTPLIHRGTVSEDQLAADVKHYPLQRYGLPSDIAHGIVYLLSDASSWVTGHSLVIDGGLTI